MTLTRRTKSLMMLYIILLIALAMIGSKNQKAYKLNYRLIDRKEELQVQVSDLRADVARYEGALSIRAWAKAKGMVPAPEARNYKHLAFTPAPEIKQPDTGLEIRTLWR